MPKTEDYCCFESYSQEPRCIPGYAGYLPGFGQKGAFKMAETYGKMTRDIISRHPIAGMRLAPILGISDMVEKEDEDKFHTWRHESMAKDVKLRTAMVPGYTGYIPRKIFSIGKGCNKTTQESVAQFEHFQAAKPKYGSSPIVTLGNALKWNCPQEDTRQKPNIPKYAGYMNTKNYLLNPMVDNSLKNLDKSCEPGASNKNVYDITHPDEFSKRVRGYRLKQFLPFKA